MENITEKVTAELNSLEIEISDRRLHMNSLVDSLKERVQNYDAFHMMTFLPDEAAQVKEEWDKLRELGERKSMLQYFLRDE